MKPLPFDERRMKALAAASYAIAVMFVFVPLMELGTQLGWTVHPQALNWRTGAVGMLSGATLTPIFGIFLAVLTASLLGHRWVQRVLGTLAGLGAVLLVAVIVIFALDALQLRPIIADNMKRAFDIAMVKAMVTFLVGTLTLLALAYSAIAASRRAPEEVEAEKRLRAMGRQNMPLVRSSQVR